MFSESFGLSISAAGRESEGTAARTAERETNRVGDSSLSVILIDVVLS